MAAEENITNTDVVQSKKQELEEKKLELEIIELERPWFQKPTFLVPIIGALSSIFILLVTGFFNTKIESLTIKREQLNYETTKLKEIKAELIKDSLNLAEAKKSLQIDTTNLSNKLKEINQENILIKETLAKNSVESENLKKKNKNLFGEINTKKQELKTISDSLDIATKPNLRIITYALPSEKEVGLYIKNSGTGIAFFKHVNFYYNGQEFIGTNSNKDRFFERVSSAMDINESWLRWEGKELNDTLEKAGSLGPSEGYFTLSVTKSQYSYSNAIKFLRAVAGLEIEIEYFSTNGKTFKLRKKIELDEMAR